MLYILRFLVATMYGIRVALGHESRTFGYPDHSQTPLCLSRQTRQRGRSAPHLADSLAQPRWPSGLLGRHKHGGDGLHQWDLEKRASCSTAASTHTQQMLSPRLHRGAHNRGPRFVERPHLTIYGRNTSRDVDRRGIRLSRWPWSSSCECALDTAFVRVMTV